MPDSSSVNAAPDRLRPVGGAPVTEPPLRPRGALLAVLLAVAAPLAMAGGTAWLAWRAAWDRAEADVAWAAEAGAAQARRALERHRIALDRVEALVQGLPDEAIRRRGADLQGQLRAMAAATPELEQASVLDAAGGRLLSTAEVPVRQDKDPAALADRRPPGPADAPALVVSLPDGVTPPRLTIARRRQAAEGFVAVTGAPDVLATALVAPPGMDLAVLLDDGGIAAATAPDGAVRQQGVAATAAVEGWPLRVRAALPRDAILGPWRRAAALHFAMALPAALLLGGLVLLLLRRQREAAASQDTLQALLAAGSAELAAREGREREILDSLGEIFYSLDADARIRFASRRALEVWRRSEATVIGRPFLDVFPPAVGSTAWEVQRKVLAAQHAAHLCVRSPLTGRWLEMDAYPVGGGGITVAFRDVEDRRRDSRDRARAIDALRETEERFRLVAETAPVMLWMGDAEGHCIYLNQALREFWGVAPHPLDSFDWVATVHPEDREALFARVGAAMRQRAAVTVEARYRRSCGEYRLLRTDARPRFAEGGRFLGMIGVNIDITERERVEAALRDSEERLRLAQEAAHIGIFDWDVRAGLVRWTPETFRLNGIDPATPPDRLLDAWRERLLPEDRERVERELATALADAAPFQLEFRIVLPDGAIRWMLCRGAVEKDATGQAQRMVGVSLDVSDLRRAEAKARESEARQRALFDAAPFSVIVIDPADHRILDVNDFACKEYGYSRTEFLDRTIADIDALGDSAAIRARGRASVVRHAAQEFEARHRTRSGQLRDVLVRAQGVDLGGQRVTFGAHVDITDRKAAEAALRASEAKLRVAIDAAQFGTWEYDVIRDAGMRQGPLADSFPAIPPEGFDLATWMTPLHPDDRAATRDGFIALIEGRSPRFEAEFRLPRPDGGWRWVASSGAVVEVDPATGTPRLVAGVARDITEAKRAEERQALLAREVDHRAKNALAVVQAALRLTQAPDMASYIVAIEGRVSALARAQSLLASNQWNGAELRTLLEGEIAPFIARQRVMLDGPAVALPPGVAQALAMVVHELATNAVKHGALSVATGRIAIGWRLADAAGPVLNLHWAEEGGPVVTEPPVRRGFGSRVIRMSVTGQLRGRLTTRWAPGGLVCEIEVPLKSTLPATAADHV